jgi:hypothetical protein
MNIAQLPPEEEDAQVHMVYALLSKDLTTYRAQLKKAASTSSLSSRQEIDPQFSQLQGSIEKSSETRNIAALAASLTGDSGIPRTAQLYVRLAFLVRPTLIQ